MEFLTRRAFLSALASSVVAAGARLPVGFPQDALGVCGFFEEGDAPKTQIWWIVSETLLTNLLHDDIAAPLPRPVLLTGKCRSQSFFVFKEDA